jgi:hypothetical protein
MNQVWKVATCLSAASVIVLLLASAIGPAHAAGPTVPAYSAAVAADAPRGYWRLGEATGSTVATDSSGSGLNGTYGPKVTVGDYVGALLYDDDLAANFAGVSGYLVGDDYLSMGTPSGLNFGTSDFTVEAWVSTETNGDQPIVTKSSGNPADPRWEIVVTDDPGYEGRVRSYIYDGAPIPLDVTAYGPSLRVDDGEFHHVVVVFDRDVGVTIYVDRAAAQKAIPMTGSVSNSAPFLVGGLANTSSFNGEIDEVAVYPSVLLAARVRAHYDAGIDPPDAYLQETLSDAPTAYWRLGESTITGPAMDASGNGVNASYGSGQVAGRPGAIVGDADTAVSFTGTDGVSVTNMSALNFGTSDFGVEAWIKTSVNGEEALVGKLASAVEPYWLVSVTDDPEFVGRVRARIFDGVVTRTAYGPNIRVDDGLWHHVGAVFDRDLGIHVYVDGAEFTTAGAATASVSNSGSFRIGQASGYATFQGDIDEVAVYDSLLEPFAFAAHHTAGISPSERVLPSDWDPALTWESADPNPDEAGEDPPGVGPDWDFGFRPGDEAVYNQQTQEAWSIYQQSGGAPESDPTPDEGVTLVLDPNEEGLDAAAPPLEPLRRPSDSTSSAGRRYLVEMVNSRIAVYRKSNLSQVSTAFLSDFTHSCDPFGNPRLVGDPQILWDRQSGRWYYSAIQRSDLFQDHTHNCILYGWSRGPNPTNLQSGWCHFYTPVIPQFNDQPTMGDGGGWIVLGTNVFPSADRDGRYLYSRLHTFRKPSRRNASRCREPNVFKSPRYHSFFRWPLSPKVANAIRPQNEAFAIGADNHSLPAELRVWAVRSQPGNPQIPQFSFFTLPIPGGGWLPPSPAEQPAPGRLLDTTDGRFTQAVTRTDPVAGSMALWTAQTIGSSMTRRSRVRWFEIMTRQRSIRQHNVIVLSTLFVFNPAVSPSWDHSMVMIQYNVSSASQSVQVRARARTAATPENSFGREAVVWTSVYPYYHDDRCDDDRQQPPRCRWGDYPGASPDVLRRGRVWGTNQVIRNPGAPGAPHWSSRNFAGRVTP